MTSEIISVDFREDVEEFSIVVTEFQSGTVKILLNELEDSPEDKAKAIRALKEALWLLED